MGTYMEGVHTGGQISASGMPIAYGGGPTLSGSALYPLQGLNPSLGGPTHGLAGVVAPIRSDEKQEPPLTGKYIVICVSLMLFIPFPTITQLLLKIQPQLHHLIKGLRTTNLCAYFCNNCRAPKVLKSNLTRDSNVWMREFHI
jgi:hypothetical protein